MKNNIIKMLYVSVIALLFASVITGCEKEEQPRYVHHGILHSAGDAYVDVKVMYEANRSSSNPLSYDSLANWGYEHISLAAKKDLVGDISNCVTWYGERYWTTKPNKQWKVWASLNIGVNANIYALWSPYAEDLLRKMESYCEFTVHGAVDQTEGVRDPALEQEMVDLIDQYEWPIKQMLRNWAQNPSNEPKVVKNGFFNTGWTP